MIDININLDENIVQRLNAVCKLKNMTFEELVKEFIQKQLVVVEEELQMEKIREDIPIELLLENFDA